MGNYKTRGHSDLFGRFTGRVNLFKPSPFKYWQIFYELRCQSEQKMGKEMLFKKNVLSKKYYGRIKNHRQGGFGVGGTSDKASMNTMGKNVRKLVMTAFTWDITAKKS